MRCPNCNQSGYQFPQPCPHCQFNDPSRLTDELGHINWLLAQIEQWDMLNQRARRRLQAQYVAQKKRLEVALGLRPPPFSPAEAAKAWPQLIRHEALLAHLAKWLEAGCLNPTGSQLLVEQTQQQIDTLLERLEGHPRLNASPTPANQLAQVNFLLKTAAQLSQHSGFASPQAEAQIREALLAEQEALEIELGLRPQPAPKPIEPEAPAVPSPTKALEKEESPAPVNPPQPDLPAAPAPQLKPAAPRAPFRERLWQTLLSERTLQAMLFLGIFLLFSAALSFVAWGWKDFSAPVRVAIPGGFTAIFFAMGWYVRSKTPMYRSGIALSAIAALLIPIDFYTIYVNFNIPAYFWPYFWLITSLACLAAYLAATLLIRSRFFGYLVGVAAGSAVLAAIEIGHQTAGLSLDWRSAGLSALALGLIMLATVLAPPGKSPPKPPPFAILADPFRYLALLSITVIMLLTFGWRFTQRNNYDTLHYALTVNWWIGSFVFGWAAIQHRSRSLGQLAALSLPVAVYLTQAAVFDRLGINPTWHGLGWALLVPLYFIVGRKLSVYKHEPVIRAHGFTAIRWGIALLLVSAFWSLTDLTNGAAAAASHAVLSGAVVIAALLWRRPVYFYGASLLAFSATTFAVTELDLTLAQLSVAWASLAIAHIIAAINLGTRFPIPAPNYAAPLTAAGYIIAGAAILPTLFPYDGGLLAYALGNWLALAAWGARLAHLKQPGFVGRGLWRKPVFHWLTAGPLPVWLWIVFTNFQPAGAGLALALGILAWVMLLLSYRLAKGAPAYRWPWYISGLLVSLTAPVVAFAAAGDGFAPGPTLVIVGLLYFADAIINRQPVELAPAGLITAWGQILLLDWFDLPVGAVSLGFAGLIGLYLLAGLWAEHRRPARFSHQFLTPLYLTAHVLTIALLMRVYLPALDSLILDVPRASTAGLWGAAPQLLLGAAYSLYAWGRYKKRWAFVAAWLVAAGFGFVAITFSTVTGSLAAEWAIIAAAFVLAERGLHRLRRRPLRNRQQAFIRLTWGLYRSALLSVGWIGSLIVMGGVLLHNFVLLGGGRSERVWAAAALWLIVGLYALSARLFRQARFTWPAAALSIAPWSILAGLAWFTPYSPTTAIFVLSWALLAWLLFGIHWGLKQRGLTAYAVAPRVVAHALLGASLLLSVIDFWPNSFAQAGGLLAVGLLYFADAVFNRKSAELAPGALVTGWGYLTLLSIFNLWFDPLGLALAVLVAGYILAGLWVERKWGDLSAHQFLRPLYLSAHLLMPGVLWQVYVRPFDALFFGVNWTDPMRGWGATSQLALGIAYGLYAWDVYKERWAHVAVWLTALSGGFIAIIFSSGRGASAAEAALGAAMLVLIERGLRQIWRQRYAAFHSRQLGFIRLTWRLYRRPLLVAGWTISAAALWLALFRNLLLLGGGRTQQVWAAAALWLVVGLYALSARLFRQARFLWLAAPLAFVPWTILTHLGWFSPYRPSLPGYALSWMLLAWALLIIGATLDRKRLAGYALPLKLTAHLLTPLALLWGVADVETGRFTFGLAVGFYGAASVLNHRFGSLFKPQFATVGRTKFFYPALALIPIWCIYLMAWLLPAAGRAHYGLMFLLFGPLGLAAGQWLRRQAKQPIMPGRYGLPAYITGYVALTVGTLLVAHQPPLLALALLFSALLMVVSAYIFKQAVWVYVAAMLAPLSLTLTLAEAGAPINRYGWWLIGLAWFYVAVTWLLHRVKLVEYGSATLIVGLLLVAVSLPPSSLDKPGALWGYGSAALLYAVLAIWLRQPLLLTPATMLAIVPYGVILHSSALAPRFYGLGLYPGAMVVLGVGWLLDYCGQAQRDFPWGQQSRWFWAIYKRFMNWWALPLYMVGFSLVFASPFFTQFVAGQMALNFLLMMLVFSWATYRFKLRGWLVATAVAGHFAAIFYLGSLGWWQQADFTQAWVRFLPVTVVMGLVTLFIEHYRNECSPLYNENKTGSWAYPLYIILSLDIMMGQFLSLSGMGMSGAWIITLTHVVLMVILASLWVSTEMTYLSLSLGVVAIMQWTAVANESLQRLVVTFAQLALAYGLLGYGLTLIRDSLDKGRELRPRVAVWELPLQRIGMGLSLGTLVLTAFVGMNIVEWSVRAFLGVPFQHIVDLATVQMAVGVFGFIGLLYVAASFTHHWLRLGYIAIGMLLTAWILHVFYIQQWDNFERVQWYAIPVGLYLLGIGYMEWHRNNKSFARWLDYAAMFLMLGSLFWQTLLFGWGFALLLGMEGLAAFFWGSARRLRRFLYAGMAGVVLATIGQLLNSLRSINQWIVFGIIGLLLVLAAVVIERKLEELKSWREILETWE